MQDHDRSASHCILEGLASATEAAQLMSSGEMLVEAQNQSSEISSTIAEAERDMRWQINLVQIVFQLFGRRCLPQTLV